MKKMFQSLALGCLVLLVAGAVVVPSAQCDVYKCVKEAIDAGSEPEDAIQACVEEAKAEQEAREAEIDAKIKEIWADLAEKKAAKDAKIKEILDNMAEQKAAYDAKMKEIWADLAEKKAAKDAKIEEIKAEIAEKIAEDKAAMDAKLADIKADIEKKHAIMEAMHTCIEEAAIDPETTPKEEFLATLEDCAVQAGAITEEEVAEIKAEMAAIQAKAEAIYAEIEAKITAIEEKKAIIDECLDTSFEDADLKELGIEGMHTIMNGCLLEAGIDIAAIKQDIEDAIVDDISDKIAAIKTIEAKIEAAKEVKEEVDMCIDAIDYLNMDKEATKEAVKACLLPDSAE